MGKQVILMVGVLDVASSTNVSQAKAFMDLGYDVIPINYRTLIQSYGATYFYDTLIKAVNEYRPYLTMFCKCNGIDPQIVADCTKMSTTFLWNPDAIHEKMERYPEVVEHAKNSTFSACTGGAVVDYFERHGVENCFHIFDGCDTDIFRPVQPVEEYKADISFIGSRLPERDQYLGLLDQAGFTVKAYGDGYGKVVVNEDFAAVCSSSEFMISINTVHTDRGFSNRLFRYMGCKSCTIHYEPTNTLHEYFKDGEEILFFKEANELITKLKFFKHKSSEIAQAGYDLVTSKYRWHDSCEQILKLAEEFKI